MKSFLYMCAAASVAFAAPVAAETQVDGVEVTAVMKPTRAEVTTISPGVARIEMWPVYGVFIGDPPAGMKILFTTDDMSGKGKVHMVTWRQLPYQKDSVCFKEPGPNWNRDPMCGTMQGTVSVVTVNLGNRRSEAFGLVPVVIDHASGEILSWVSHPENTQAQVECAGEENTVSVFYIDQAGKVSIASREQRKSYEAAHCRGG